MTRRSQRLKKKIKSAPPQGDEDQWDSLFKPADEKDGFKKIKKLAKRPILEIIEDDDDEKDDE